jgi:hypothetical protein
MLLREVESLKQSIDELINAQSEYDESLVAGDYNRFLAAQIRLENAKIKNSHCSDKFQRSFEECQQLQRMMD